MADDSGVVVPRESYGGFFLLPALAWSATVPTREPIIPNVRGEASETSAPYGYHGTHCRVPAWRPSPATWRRLSPTPALSGNHWTLFAAVDHGDRGVSQ